MKDRNTLKKYFKTGSLPTQAYFENLIDSSVNKIDDGFSKTEDEGLMLANPGTSEKIISLYENIEDEYAQWTLELNKEDSKNPGPQAALNFVVPEKEATVLTLVKEGKVGINQPNPEYDLHVNQWLASKGRVGTYNTCREIPANGNWHRIIENLNYCQGFEIVARTGIKNTGKHTLVHAIAMSAFGDSHAKIRVTGARYSFWRKLKIELRWTGDTFKYHLEMRCKQNLGADTKIKYHITQLWSDEDMDPEGMFHTIE